MGQEYQVRQATFADAPNLARLRWGLSEGEAAETTFEDFKEEFARFLNEAFCRGNWNVWVAEQEGELIAGVYIHRIERVPRPGQAQDRWGLLTDSAIAPHARHQGVEAALLAAVIGWAREQGFERLQVALPEGNASFYEQWGFRRAGEALELAL